MNTNETPAQAVRQLRDQIRRHDQLYYGLDRPEISDAEYDHLFRRLQDLERNHPETADPNSPTRRVGGQPIEAFEPATHPAPMLSLSNVFSETEFQAWRQRIQPAASEASPDSTNATNATLQLVAEPKIDGLALRLRYVEGQLVLAATRGNGETGEDVTHNARTVRNLPLALHGASPPPVLEVRGEVYIPTETFRQLNQERSEQGLPPYANPRNAAAGAMRQLDPRLAADRRLRIWIYADESPDSAAETHWAALSALAALGFPINPANRLLNEPAAAPAYHESCAANRAGLDYEIDGVVFKVNSLDRQRELGHTGREPRYATAWKFPAQRATTTLRSISISHGRFGRLTPVAELEPVTVGGVTVQSASLHNEEDLRRKDIRPGARVLVERAGDVIPQVVGPADPAQNLLLPEFSMPTDCPACATPVQTIPEEIGHWCFNDACPSRLHEQLQNFVSKKAMDIDGLGERWCRALIDAGLIDHPARLYHLERADLLQLDRMGDRLADRILSNIEKSRQRPLKYVLYALGIYRLGREASTLLTDRYASLEQVSGLTEAELIQIDGIGPKIAESVVRGFASARVQKSMELLASGGVRTGAPEPATPQNQATPTEGESDSMNNQQPNENFANKVFVVTGKLETMTRSDAEGLIQAQGGRVASGVTAKTDHLVVGAKPGSKLTKARALNVPVMTEAELLNLAGVH